MYKNNILLITIGLIALLGLFISSSDYIYIPDLTIFNQNPAPQKPNQKLPAGSGSDTSIDVLQKNTWVWIKTETDGVIVRPNKPDVFTVTFNKDNTISGSTDCNGFGGEVTIGDNGVMSFGPFMSTLMFCEGSQEGEFIAAVASANHYLIDKDGGLILLIGSGDGRMMFNKK